ncbi:MAG: hypothetical protein ACP5NC_02950 [Nitrososphaeria archaeon]
MQDHIYREETWLFAFMVEYKIFDERSEEIASQHQEIMSMINDLESSEGNAFRCHRSLIADALTVRGIDVIHISGNGPGKRHRLTPFAKVDGYRITYPGP